MELKLTALFEQVPERNVGYVEELPRATTPWPRGSGLVASA